MFKLIITTPERRRSTLFIVNFEQIFFLVVVFLQVRTCRSGNHLDVCAPYFFLQVVT